MLPLASDIEEVPCLVKKYMLFMLKERAMIQNQVFWGREVPDKLRFKNRARSLPKLFRDQLVNSWVEYHQKVMWSTNRIYLVMGWAYGQSAKGFEHLFTGYIRRWSNDWYDRKYLLFVPIPPPPSIQNEPYGESVETDLIPIESVGTSLSSLANAYSYVDHKDSWLFRKT